MYRSEARAVGAVAVVGGSARVAAGGARGGARACGNTREWPLGFHWARLHVEQSEGSDVCRRAGRKVRWGCVDR